MCVWCKIVDSNGGVNPTPESRNGMAGSWHRRFDNRFVRCTGNRDQSEVEAVMETASKLQDKFDDVLIVAVCGDGMFYAGSQNKQENLLKMQRWIAERHFVSGHYPTPSSPAVPESAIPDGAAVRSE